ncbi:MAG: hypothetical protein AVDCRST_MAG86-1882 [uncultured Truepera sp.]|uniref:ABC-type glycine betaine transport system substrate-binding domain-containing protein n=1 Tax=uncultured Truepera sp. TaxID=543023 RepID=A0A6J4VCB6_9DEIN|nr:MAG: hypothetical protein AVDCRST_MAG86-1882 [uncultured Truepera sp.]
MKTSLILLAICLLSNAALGAPQAKERAAEPVVIGSANFAESELLAEIFAQALEANNVAVERNFSLGSREVYLEALKQGEIDLVPEYLGSALRYLSGDAAAGDSTAAATQKALQRTLRKTELRALDYARAESTQVVVVTKALADKYELADISDLQNAADELVFGGSAECMERTACYRGLTDVYGLHFREIKTLDTAGPATVKALAGGEVDVTFLFSTQGVITERGFVILADDRGAQPAENIVPIVRTENVQSLGERLTGPLGAVTQRLTTDELRTLNAQLAEGEALKEVARTWLAK